MDRFAMRTNPFLCMHELVFRHLHVMYVQYFEVCTMYRVVEFEKENKEMWLKFS